MFMAGLQVFVGVGVFMLGVAVAGLIATGICMVVDEIFRKE